MNPLLLVQLVEALAAVVSEGVGLFQQGQAVLSETDAAAIHAALLKAEAATASLRPQVDAALEAAAQIPE